MRKNLKKCLRLKDTRSIEMAQTEWPINSERAAKVIEKRKIKCLK